MDVTKPYEFIRFGAMDVTKPCEFIGFGAMDGLEARPPETGGTTMRSTSETTALKLMLEASLCTSGARLAPGGQGLVNAYLLTWLYFGGL